MSNDMNKEEIDKLIANVEYDPQPLIDYIINLQESEAYYYGQYKDYKSRNEKAIEYIETKWKKDSYYEDIDNCLQFCNFSEFDKEDLLDILKGEENEEN